MILYSDPQISPFHTYFLCNKSGSELQLFIPAVVFELVFLLLVVPPYHFFYPIALSLISLKHGDMALLSNLLWASCYSVRSKFLGLVQGSSWSSPTLHHFPSCYIELQLS